MSAVRAELLVHACTAPEAALANAFPQERSPITTWSQWLDRATNRDSDRQIARKAGLTHTTIGRWRRSGEAAAEGVVAIARAYGADPIEGLLEAGILTERDLIDPALRNAVRRAPTVYLTDELHARATAAEAAGDVDNVRHMFRGWR